MREVEDDIEDDERFDNDRVNMINDLHSNQIAVKKNNFEPQPAGSRSMMIQKRPNAIGGGIGSGIGGGIGSGIGSGLKRPTGLKAPTTV